MLQTSKQIDQAIETDTAAADKPSVAVSIVVPVTERCDDLCDLYRAHAVVLTSRGYSFEFIFVFDGGFQEQVSGLEALVAQGEPIRIVTLARSFGEATALMVGFEQAQGEILLTLAAYFQVVPEGLVQVLSMVHKGYDCVIARRCPRIDSWLNQLQTLGFNSLVRRLTGVGWHDMSCGLKGLHRRVVQELHLYGDLHRFLPLLAYQGGFRVTEVDIPQHPADSWVRVYRPGVYLRRLLDILTLVFLCKFVRKPLRFFGLIGVGFFTVGLLISLVLTVERLLGLTGLADRPLLILGVLLMVLGIQTGTIGFLGEIVIFTHAGNEKDYKIDKILE
jgi:glycosyltransferase involved in cell wall biosynthesis